MNFSTNSPVLFILAGLTIAVVLAQSFVFCKKAWKRALELNISESKLKKIVTQTIVFTIAPAIAVGIGLITLVPLLGIPLPWVRLSVVGALPYELSAAQAASDAVGAQLGAGLTAQQFTTIAWTMTIGIITGSVLIPVFCKKTTTGISNIGNKDKKWGEHLSNAVFYGLIATFVGKGLSGIRVSSEGRINAIVLLISALIMCLCGFLRGKFKWKWINDYAIPICMIASMACAIPLTILLG